MTDTKMNFSAPKYVWQHDDYMTPKYAWENISHLIPKDKQIWEPFYGDGKSGDYLQEILGSDIEIIHKNEDFFKVNYPDTTIITNPPFSRSKEVLTRLKELGKPFIIIQPVSKMNTQWFRSLFKGDKNFQIIIPPKRINFARMVDGKVIEGKSHANFECNYYCWKIGLENDITWLD